MNIENLQYFVSLAETLNFTKAAQKCHIAQTAMSRYIAQLERFLGVKLFERDKRNVRITKAGEQFYRDVIVLQAQYQKMLSHIKEVASTEKTHLKIGFGLYEFSSLSSSLTDFARVHPEIQLEIHQYEYGILVEKLEKGELDMIVALEICKDYLQTDHLELMYLFTSSNNLVMNREKYERYKNETVSQVLEQEVIITNCENSGPSSVSMMKKTLSHDFGVREPRWFQTNSYEAQLLMIQAGQGVAFIPDFIKDQLPGDLVAWELPGSTEFQYFAMYHKEDQSQAIAQVRRALQGEQ